MCARSQAAVAFALIYLTFFLDNVLLTVLVPIIPDWVRGESLALWREQSALWREQAAPLADLLNHTMQRAPPHGGGGGAQALVGLVLGARACAQLCTAPLAARAACRAGPVRVLRCGTLTLALAALGECWCARTRGVGAAICVGAARALQGAGGALAAVAGLSLATRLPLPPRQRARAVGVLLGAVALGVLVGYPFGGATSALWTRGAPFLLIAAALLADLALQHLLLEEPFDRRWAVGAVFVPDSAGYLVATSALGGAARALGAERVALAGQLLVGLAALAVPHATSVPALAVPHACLGLGLGALDVALVPAVLARRRARAPLRAALLQAASSAAAAIGPVVGGVLSWGVGFESTLRALGVANLLYAAWLYRALRRDPLSEQWGATVEDEDEGSGDEDSEPPHDCTRAPPLSL